MGVVACLALAGCSSGGTQTGGTDASTDATEDAGDDGGSVDGSTADVVTVDSSPEEDSGVAEDTGVVEDTGVAEDTGADVESTDAATHDSAAEDATPDAEEHDSAPDTGADAADTGADAADAGPDAADAGPDAADASSDANDAATNLCLGVTCQALDQCHSVGTCDPTTGLCSNPPLSGTTCDDGNGCTQNDSCQNGTCTGGSSLTCFASDQCHVAGTCDPATGVCSNPNVGDGTLCNDGNACTRTAACESGTCTATSSVTCSALDACHIAGTCDPTSGQCSNPTGNDGASCSDGNACTRTAACESGTCTATSSVTCSALDSCHVAGTCDPTSGQCSNPDAGSGTSCPASGPCTAGTCDGSGNCAQTNVSDGASCGSGLVCSAGSCVANCDIGGTLYAAGTANPNNACQVCTPSNDTTNWSPASAGTTCDDGNSCTTGDMCDGAGNCGGTACSSGICSNALSAFTGTQTQGWNFNGNAFYDADTNTAVLVDGTSTGGQAGTLLYQNPIALDGVTVNFDFTVTQNNGRADGLTFVMETNGNTAVGAGYGGFGVMGLTGYATELDLFDSGPCDNGNGNHAGIDYLVSCAGGNPSNSGIPLPIATSGDLYTSSTSSDHGVGDIGDGTTRTAYLQFASGQMSVSITDPSTGLPIPVTNLQQVTLPGYVAGTPYYIGFGGGSGSNGQASRIEISNVSISFGANECL